MTTPDGENDRDQVWEIVVIISRVSRAVAVYSGRTTSSSSASWSRFSPPSNFVNGHVSTMWFAVCRWPRSPLNVIGRDPVCGSGSSETEFGRWRRRTAAIIGGFRVTWRVHRGAHRRRLDEMRQSRRTDLRLRLTRGITGPAAGTETDVCEEHDTPGPAPTRFTARKRRVVDRETGSCRQ